MNAQFTHERNESHQNLTLSNRADARVNQQEKHFPTAMREFAAWRSNPSARGILATAFQSLCEAIEDKYGRLTPNVCEEEAYEKNRLFYVQEVINDKHIDEKMGSTFLHVLDLNSIKQQLRSTNCILNEFSIEFHISLIFIWIYS